jgi:26S proteasome regulatory subunit N1
LFGALTAVRRRAVFQTHDTPVLLAVDERAELATEKWLPVSPLLEGVVIVRKNPAYIEGTE